LSLRAKLADSGAKSWVKCTVNLWSSLQTVNNLNQNHTMDDIDWVDNMKMTV